MRTDAVIIVSSTGTNIIIKTSTVITISKNTML